MALLQDDQTAAAPTFTWGAGGARMTPDEIAARRKVADALMAQAGNGSPFAPGTRGAAGQWTQGLAQIAKGISAGLDYRAADQASKANDAENKQMIAALLGGGAPAAAASPVASAATAAVPTSVAASGPVVPDDTNAVPGTVGMNQRLADLSQDFIDDHPGTSLSSGVRSTADQARLYADRENNPNPVAPPGTSHHEIGTAVDIGGMTPADRAMLPQYGLAQPVANDPPHVELARAAVAPVVAANASADDEVSPAVAKVAGAMPAAATDSTTPANAAPTQGFAVPGQPAVAKVSGALSGVNPAVIQAMTSPYASPATKQIASLIAAQQMKPKAAAPYSDPNLGIVQQAPDGTLHVLRAPQATAPYSDPDLGTVQRGPDGAVRILRPPAAGDAYKDADGNLMQKGADGTLHAVIQADKPTAEQKDFEYGQAHPGFYDRQDRLKKLTGTTINNLQPGEDKGLIEAQKLDAEAVRKGQNEQVPALEDADHNFQLMQAAIDRNGGKLPTGGELGKMGLDWNRTKDYIAQNWGVDLGSDPNTTASLETFNKGGIKAAGEMAKAIGGSRVLKTEFDMAQKANPGLETSDAGNKYLLDVNRNGIAIKRDFFQAQEDYWRAHNHSLDGFQKEWNDNIHSNPRPLSSFSVAPPIDSGAGSQFVKLPSTAKGGYSWFEKGPNGTNVVSDPAITGKLDGATVPAPVKTAAPEEKDFGGKTYVKQDGNWFEKR